ncbi:MAG: sulfatase-like hydrolase/transferase, partial [Planctomycetota bacterium]|jgi:arylsulfatase A-like enzyme
MCNANAGWKIFFMFAAAFFLKAAIPTHAADRPNILWITAEDMSPTLGCYGDDYAMTPHLDALARQSILFTNAFATAPVCSPSRSCLINGAYAPSQSTHNMRSALPIPPAMTGFPGRLRAAGYYTSNNVKTDYNTAYWQEIIASSWDVNSETAHWRGKKGRGASGQNFFSVFNLMESHQSRTMVWPYERFEDEVQSILWDYEIHDPKKAPLPPYYVDTPTVRRAVARYYDCLTVMDKKVGVLLQQLQDDGLADDTIVFFYSDHGSGMPRHKRALLDSGMRVALMVRIPEKFHHLAAPLAKAGAELAGSRTDRLVSFVDFAPTVLKLAGLQPPGFMQGQAFLGDTGGDAEGRRYAYGHRDRVDEVIDMARSVRDKRYLYIRNYMPHLGYNQRTWWPDLGAIRHEIYRLTDAKKMTDAQWRFAGPTRPAEELYDCQADPQNLRNLAGDPQHANTLDRMRGALRQHVLTTHDTGYLPESMLWRRLGNSRSLWEVARSKGLGLRSALAAAERVGAADEEELIEGLIDQDGAVRYWSAVGLNARSEMGAAGVAALQKALEDGTPSVRTEAAYALCRHGRLDAGLPVLIAQLKQDNLAAVLHAARAIETLGPKTAPSARAAMEDLDRRMKIIRPADTSPVIVQPGRIDMAMFVGFSTDAFLNAE